MTVGHSNAKLNPLCFLLLFLQSLGALCHPPQLCQTQKVALLGFGITACQALNLPTGMLKPNLCSLFLPNISAIIPTDFSFPSVIKGFLLPM